MKVFLSYALDDAALAEHVCKALADSGLIVTHPDRDHLPGDNWAGGVARALEESEAMVVLLTPAAASSPDIKRNIEYALGAQNYSNRLIPVVVGGRERFPAAEMPWIVRRMPWFELDDTETEPPKVEPIAEAILSHAWRSFWSPVPVPDEVFLSHSSADRGFTAKLADVLRDHGVPVWYSDTNIRGAQQWHDEIGAALRRCDWLVVVLTPDAVESRWVKRELLFSLQQDRFDGRIAPIMYRACNHDELSWTLASLQMVDFREDFDRGCRDLLRIWGIGYAPRKS